MTSRPLIVAIFTLLFLTTPTHAAEPPAGTAKSLPECALAKNATECAEILKKLGKNPFDAFGYTGSEPVYGGKRNPLAEFLYNWQTLITGGLAIIAALIGAWAAYHVGSAQMAAAKRKDRLQARCIAVAISPELLDLKVRHERASKIISEEFPKAKRPGMMTDGVVALICDAQIEIPPLLSRSLDQLYILDEAGPTLLQLISVVLQYNNLVTTLASQIRQHVDRFNPPEHQKDLSGHLQVIGQNIANAERLIGPIHDEATAG